MSEKDKNLKHIQEATAVWETGNIIQILFLHYLANKSATEEIVASMFWLITQALKTAEQLATTDDFGDLLQPRILLWLLSAKRLHWEFMFLFFVHRR